MKGFKHKRYAMGFTVTPDNTPLPKDKRRKPWPAIRQYKLKVNTMGEFEIEYLTEILKKNREGCLNGRISFDLERV